MRLFLAEGYRRLVSPNLPGNVRKAALIVDRYADVLATQKELLDARSQAKPVRDFCLAYRTKGKSKDDLDPDGAHAFLCLVAAICFREGIIELNCSGASPATLVEEGCIMTPRKTVASFRLEPALTSENSVSVSGSKTEGNFIMSIPKVALIYDNQLRPNTTGGLVEVQHYLPLDLARIPRQGFDLYLNIDDGLEYRLPADLHPCVVSH